MRAKFRGGAVYIVENEIHFPQLTVDEVISFILYFPILVLIILCLRLAIFIIINVALLEFLYICVRDMEAYEA